MSFDDPALALGVVRQLAALAVALQTIELLAIRRVAADDGIWTAALVGQDLAAFGRPLAAVLRRLMAYRVFVAILIVRLLAAIALPLVGHIAPVAFLFASTVLIALRWRGTFNGGSDFMTIIVLGALTVAQGLPEHEAATQGALWYLALQACSSYFVAGVTKLRRPAWRNGRALRGFAASAVFADGAPARLLQRATLARLAGWAVIALECSFPLALVHPTAAAGLTGLAALFHLGNVYVFGLDRFLWAWVATYPAVLYCAGQLLSR